MVRKQPHPPGRFFGMLWQLLVLLKTFPALFLIALSFLEAVLVFKGGHQVAKQPCLHATVRFCGLRAYGLHFCSWTSCWPILPDYCGSATLFIRQNKSHLSSAVCMQHNCEIHNLVAVRAASVQVCCDMNKSPPTASQVTLQWQQLLQLAGHTDQDITATLLSEGALLLALCTQ